jgi:hypothetical protein
LQSRLGKQYQRLTKLIQSTETTIIAATLPAAALTIVFENKYFATITTTTINFHYFATIPTTFTLTITVFQNEYFPTIITTTINFATILIVSIALPFYQHFTPIITTNINFATIPPVSIALPFYQHHFTTIITTTINFTTISTTVITLNIVIDNEYSPTINFATILAIIYIIAYSFYTSGLSPG